MPHTSGVIVARLHPLRNLAALQPSRGRCTGRQERGASSGHGPTRRRSQRIARRNRLPAPSLTTATFRSARGNDHVARLPRQARRTPPQFAAHNQSPADAGAKGDRHQRRRCGGQFAMSRQGNHVGIVVDSYGKGARLHQGGHQVDSNRHRGVGSLHRHTVKTDVAGDSSTHRDRLMR